jgi:AraC-like DNA-binding protein
MTAETPHPPQRTSFSTANPVEARDFLDRAFGGDLQIASHRDTSWQVSVTRVDTGQFNSSAVALPADLKVAVHGIDEVIVNSLDRGLVRMDVGKDADCFKPGDVHLGNFPEMDGASHGKAAGIHTIGLPRSLLSHVAGEVPAHRAGAVRFLSLAPVAGGAARWRATSRFVDGLLAEPETAASPLLIGSAARLLAATVLAIFPNTAVAEPAAADSVDAHPGTLRRATAFIDAHCDRDIDLADIARAAYVTPRAVQLAFRRQLGTTPTAYLRQVRLAQAHLELRDAAPGDGVTVTAVAARWGFTPSRFTERYRAAYGVLPSHTLRS